MISVFSDEKTIAKFGIAVKRMLNGKLAELPDNSSPRTVGDFAQELITSYFAELPVSIGKAGTEVFARRSMADAAFVDKHGNYVIVDVKTHNVGTSFNMPNLTSVERIARFYEDDANYFSILMAKYEITNGKPVSSGVLFVPIEHLDWDCLTIGALGWGQIQIANSNNIKTNATQSRKQWMLKLCDALDVFYPREITKITERIAKFKKVREFWENKS